MVNATIAIVFKKFMSLGMLNNDDMLLYVIHKLYIIPEYDDEI